MSANRQNTTTRSFSITGRVDAETPDQARDRVLRLLRHVGFKDIGDGTLWLERPAGPFDDAGMALAEETFYVDTLEINGAAER